MSLKITLNMTDGRKVNSAVIHIPEERLDGLSDDAVDELAAEIVADWALKNLPPGWRTMPVRHVVRRWKCTNMGAGAFACVTTYEDRSASLSYRLLPNQPTQDSEHGSAHALRAHLAAHMGRRMAWAPAET